MTSISRTTAVMTGAALLGAVVALTVVIAQTGDNNGHAAHQDAVSGAAAPDKAAAVAPPVTVASIAKALAASQQSAQSETAVLTRDGATVSKDVIVTPANGSPSDTYYDAGTTLLSRTGAQADGRVIVVDYVNKQDYPFEGASLPTTDHSWITNGLTSGAFTLNGNQITGKDKFGSPVTISINPATSLPTTSTVDQPAGLLTETYQWSTNSAGVKSAAAADAIDRAAVISVPATFKHLKHAPKAAIRKKGSVG